jgi:hypothetical protein
VIGAVCGNIAFKELVHFIVVITVVLQAAACHL